MAQRPEKVADGGLVMWVRRWIDSRSIFVPTFQGRRGHPLALAWLHVEGIRAHAAGEGLNRYVRKHSTQVWEVPVQSEAILWDLDTPEDYQRLRQQWSLSAC